jgi:hypothetical protein
MQEYIVKFYNDDETVVERKYRLINSSTMKARSILFKFYSIKDSDISIDNTVLKQMTTEEKSLNELMSQILVGDHKDVNWMEADSTQIDEVLKDFFMSFMQKMSTSS